MVARRTQQPVCRGGRGRNLLDHLGRLHRAVLRLHRLIHSFNLHLGGLRFQQLGLGLQRGVLPLLRLLGLLVLGQLEILGVKPLPTAQLGGQLGRIELIHRIGRCLQQAHQELLLRVTLHQRRRCTHIDLEVPLNALVLAVSHHPIEVPLDMRARHVVVKALGQPAQHARGVVVLHLHAPQRVGRIAANALQHGWHAGGVLGHL